MAKWDLYDKNFKKTSEVIDAHDEIEDGKYHFSVNLYIINSKKQLLLIRKSLNYNLHYPGFWNIINGNVISGESIDEACRNAVFSKIGINIQSNEFNKIDTKLRDPYHYIYETYVIYKDIDLKTIKFIDNIYVQAKWVDLQELYDMISNGEIAWVLVPRIEEYIVKLMK